MNKKTKKLATIENSTVVNRDGKTVGVEVKTHSGVSQFPFGCTWRWRNILGYTMLEVLDSGTVIYQSPIANIVCVCGPTWTQPVSRTTEYPG